MSTRGTVVFFFFFNDTATTEIYTLSLHDALPICSCLAGRSPARPTRRSCPIGSHGSSHWPRGMSRRSEEHTSELQSRLHLVCRLLLEKKKKKPFSRTLAMKPVATSDFRCTSSSAT